jgi:hypothetical protein
LAKDGVIKILQENKNKKAILVLTIDMESVSLTTGEEVHRIVPFSSKAGIILESTDLGEFYEKAKDEILENMEKYNKMGSNCTVSAILKMDINLIDYRPIGGRSYIPLDDFLSSKKAIINMENEDNECFKWCVTRALNMKEKHGERIDKDLIEKSKKLNWEGIEFPVKLDQIKKFEKNNPDISVNVFGYEKKSIHPLRISKCLNRKHEIDLLLISDEKTNHYCLIKNLSRLISSQASKET